MCTRSGLNSLKTEQTRSDVLSSPPAVKSNTAKNGKKRHVHCSKLNTDCCSPLNAERTPVTYIPSCAAEQGLASELTGMYWGALCGCCWHVPMECEGKSLSELMTASGIRLFVRSIYGGVMCGPFHVSLHFFIVGTKTLCKKIKI